MKEADRGCGGRGLYANSMVGKRGFEVFPGRAVVQGTRDSVGRSGWAGTIRLWRAQWKKIEAEICWEQDMEMQNEPKRAKNSSLRESFHAASGGERS